MYKVLATDKGEFKIYKGYKLLLTTYSQVDADFLVGLLKAHDHALGPV